MKRRCFVKVVVVSTSMIGKGSAMSSARGEGWGCLQYRQVEVGAVRGPSRLTSHLPQPSSLLSWITLSV